MNWNPGRTSSRKSLRHAATTLATASLLALVIAPYQIEDADGFVLTASVSIQIGVK
jgi:hypothetical protein